MVQGLGTPAIAHRWHKNASQATCHTHQLILMPARTLPKLKQYSYPFIINFNFEAMKVKVLVAQLCLILCNPLGYNPPASFVLFSRQEY